MAPTPEKTNGKMTGKKNRSRSQVDRTLFRTGTCFNAGFKTALYLRPARRKQSTYALQTLASALHLENALRTTQFGSVRRHRKKLFSDAEWPSRCSLNHDGMRDGKFKFERIRIAVRMALDFASLSAI